MRLERPRGILRLICVLLLSWTAVDLGASGLCALDREDAPLVSSDRNEVGSDSTPTPTPLAAHVDDCFCCSHCVNLTHLLPPVTLTVAPAALTPTAADQPRHIARPMYHPPKTSR